MTNREKIVGNVGVWPLKLLAKRWVCSDTAIRDREKAGLLKQCEGVPGVCYTGASVAEREGCAGNQNPMSPFERRKLEMRIRELEKQLESYEDQFYFLADALERARTSIERREKQRDEKARRSTVWTDGGSRHPAGGVHPRHSGTREGNGDVY